MSELRSWLLGAMGLWIALAVSAVISMARPFPDLAHSQRRAFVALGLTAWGVQAAHFCEELLAGFYTEFPTVLGLPPWSRLSFTVFNGAWLVIWMVSIFAAVRGLRLAEWPVWFLALGLLVNGIAHPVLALRTGGYFPGLLTALPALVTGVVLLRWMVRTTGTINRTGPLPPAAHGSREAPEP